jgi:phage terminase small subunit
VGTLTKKQTDFIIHYVESRNIFQSALLAGYSQTFAKSRSHELLKNPAIAEKITNLTESYYKEQFQELAIMSIKALAGVIEDTESRSTQLQAIKYVLNEAGLAEQDEKQTGTIEIKVQLPKGFE